MDERKKGSSPLNIPTVLLLTAVAGGLYLVPSPLRSSRPSEKESLERTSRGDQVVLARLWQDPLEAAKNYRAKLLAIAPAAGSANIKLSMNEFPALGELAKQIARQSEQVRNDYPTETNLTILQVFISGGSYAEDAETRLRARYAVLSALGFAGYVPYDAEHIGYAEVHWPRGAELEHFPTDQFLPLSSMANSEGGRLIVPFEWLEQSKLAPRATNETARMILVLWLNGDAFDDHPAKRLAQFMWELREKVPQEFTDKPPCTLNFKLLDPRLRNMLDESFYKFRRDGEDAEEWKSIRKAFDGMEVYSTYATTADTVLKSEFMAERRRYDVTTNLHELYGLNFVNATCTDDELAKALCDELERRGVDFATGKDCVALISEWDTFYGRALPVTFAAEVLCRTAKSGYTNRPKAIRDLKNGTANFPTNIFRYTYLRGVDGILPGEKPRKEEATKDANKTKEAGEPDRPEGPSQLDYMPRLAGKIEGVEARMQSSGRRELKAIGILGSDAYDKLLVLQTLRPRFRDELFFTTDMDARLLHPSEQKWTRNVIVASSFGLHLRGRLQRETPPFRDTYQTAQYLATLAAVGRVSTNILDELSPRLFEIGRNGAYDLSVDTKVTNIYPTRPNLFPQGSNSVWYITKNTLWMLFVGALALALVVVFDPTDGKWREIASTRYFAWRVWCAVGIVPLLAIIFALIVRDHFFNREGEPFSLWEGISIWPTEIIRLCAAGLSAYFILKTRHELRKSKDKFAQDYDGLPHRLEKEAVEDLWKQQKEQNRKARSDSEKQSVCRRLLDYWRWISIHSWDAEEFSDEKSGRKRVDAKQLCDIYNRLGFFAHRLYRFLLSAVLYLILAICLVVYSESPFSPSRGRFSFWVDGLAFWLSLVLQIILTFYVLDATCLCKKFISNLTKGPTVWPPPTCARFEEECRLHRDYLDEWIDIRVIGDRTKVVGKLIFYPFIGLFLIIISRNGFFDRWDWPVWLILVLGVNSAYAIYSVLVLRRAAEKARHDALERLNEKLLRVLGGEKKLLAAPLAPDQVESSHSATEPSGRRSAEKDEPKLAEQIRTLLQKIKDYEEGAFAPLSQHPVVAALAMPFGGAGILALLDFLAAR